MRTRLAWLLFAVAPGPVVARAELPPLRIVAGTGVPLPSGDGFYAAVTERCSIARDGDLAFLVDLEAHGTREGAVAYEIDSSPIIAAGRSVLILGMGDLFGFDAPPSLAGDALLFFASVDDRESVYTHDGATAILLARAGMGPPRTLLPGLQRFGVFSSNAMGAALLRESTSVADVAIVRVDVTGAAERIAQVPGPAPDDPREVSFVLDGASIADDGQVVFQAEISEGATSADVVYYRPAGDPTLRRVAPPAPIEPDDRLACCRLLGASHDGIVAVTAARTGPGGPRTDLFVGSPETVSLALSIARDDGAPSPTGGEPIVGAPGHHLLSFAHTSLVMAAGGAFAWASLDGVRSGDRRVAALLTFRPGEGVRLVAEVGAASPGGATFGRLTPLAMTRAGEVIFADDGQGFGRSVWRARPGAELERLVGPGDAFRRYDGVPVTVTEASSCVDSRALEAGHLALWVEYDTGSLASRAQMLVADVPPEPVDLGVRVTMGSTESGAADTATVTVTNQGDVATFAHLAIRSTLPFGLTDDVRGPGCRELDEFEERPDTLQCLDGIPRIAPGESVERTYIFSPHAAAYFRPSEWRAVARSYRVDTRPSDDEAAFEVDTQPPGSGGADTGAEAGVDGGRSTGRPASDCHAAPGRGGWRVPSLLAVWLVAASLLRRRRRP